MDFPIPVYLGGGAVLCAVACAEFVSQWRVMPGAPKTESKKELADYTFANAIVWAPLFLAGSLIALLTGTLRESDAISEQVTMAVFFFTAIAGSTAVRRV